MRATLRAPVVLVVVMIVTEVEDDVITARRFVGDEQPKRQAKRLPAPHQWLGQVLTYGSSYRFI